jgi:hypothetical protein
MYIMNSELEVVQRQQADSDSTDHASSHATAPSSQASAPAPARSPPLSPPFQLIRVRREPPCRTSSIASQSPPPSSASPCATRKEQCGTRTRTSSCSTCFTGVCDHDRRMPSKSKNSNCHTDAITDTDTKKALQPQPQVATSAAASAATMPSKSRRRSRSTGGSQSHASARDSARDEGQRRFDLLTHRTCTYQLHPCSASASKRSAAATKLKSEEDTSKQTQSSCSPPIVNVAMRRSTGTSSTCRGGDRNESPSLPASLGPHGTGVVIRACVRRSALYLYIVVLD